MELITEIGKLTANILSSSYSVHYFEELNSTNTYAKEHFEAMQTPAVVITDLQTQGRGRNKNIWLPTATGKSLYATWVYKTFTPPPPVLPMRIGLRIYSACQQHLKIDVALKAPNDIYVGNEKLAGILIEGTHFKNTFYTFIGFGFNVYTKPQLEQTTHLTAHTKFETNRWSDFIREVSKELEQAIHLPQNKLNSSEMEELQKALKKHSSFIDLQSISEYGDLIFKNYRKHWLDL